MISPQTIIRVGIYAGIGLLVYAGLVLEGPMDWSNPSVYVTMALWPFFLIGLLGFWVIVISVAIGVITLIIYGIGTAWDELAYRRPKPKKRLDRH